MAVILGINAFHPGASAALIIDGKPVIAIAEERLNRIKNYASFPALAINECLRNGGVRFRDIDYVALGTSASANTAKKMQHIFSHPMELPNLLKIKASRGILDDVKSLVSAGCHVDPEELRFKQINIEHHLAHIASAYFISPWERCAGFSMDGSGDFVTCMLARCEGNKIDIAHRVYAPHSLGRFYAMICEFIGYPEYGDEGKVMALASYGDDSYANYFEKMIRLTKDSFRFNPNYFMPFGSNGGMSVNEKGEMVFERQYSDYMVRYFGQPRKPKTEIGKREHSLAFGAQRIFEKAYLHMLNVLHGMVPEDRVAMAGGAVFNCVANGKIFDHTPFLETTIQPAAGDEGLALGAALYLSRAVLGEKERYVMSDAYLGPEYSETEIERTLKSLGIDYVYHSRESLLRTIADEISEGDIVGWFQGRMEWGPRALGNRSILSNPGLADIKKRLNERIKHREGFRPFAPSVLVERQADIFGHTRPSPFMQHVYKVNSSWRGRLTAVCHVDNTSRLHSVNRAANPLYYDLIKLCGEKTGAPVVLNTSFNENEPIVLSPTDAIECFLRTKMDVLAIGPFICRKMGMPDEK